YAGWLLDGLRFEGAGLLLSAARVNLATCAEILARSFSLGRNPVLDTLAVVAVLLLCGAGVAAWVTRARVSLLFLALYMAMVLVWPFSPLRFVWGAWPLFVVLMVSGVAYLLTARARSRWRSRLPVLGVVAAAIVTLGTLNFNMRGYVNHWWATVGRSIAPRIQPQLQWTVTHTDSADVIAAEDEGAVYLYTGRQAVPVAAFSTRQYFRERAPEESATDLANILVALHPKYVIAWAVPTMRAASLLAAAKPPLLQQIDSIPGGRVFRRVPSP